MRGPASDLPITFENASVAVGAITILEHIRLTLMPGAPTVLIGPNGAGKTTLLRVAMGLTSVSQGRVTWGGRVAVAPQHRAIVFQRPVMLRRSAEANIRYALSAAGVARADQTKQAAELLTLVGLEGMSCRPARRLSGGEQQRLALARALARNPDVLFLDEPTASLDPASTKAIEDVIHTISRRGTKVVMSTHDLAQARRVADEIVLLHRGRIVETGPAFSFFNAPQSSAAKNFLAGELLV